MIYTLEQNNIFQFVQTGTGNGIIDAVAGAGKTSTILECARYVNGSSKALFCAFNKSIAKEIGLRLGQKGLSNVTVKTIHALGWQMLKTHKVSKKGIDLQERKYDVLLKSQGIQLELQVYLERIIRLNGFEPELAKDDKFEAFAIKNLLFKINRRLLDINQKFRATLCKPTLDDFKNFVVHFNIFNELEVKKKQLDTELECYLKCTEILLSAGNELASLNMIMDFTDMIYLPYLWNLQAGTKFDFIFIDECQDLSPAQIAVVLKHGKETSRVLAVGDPRQSIYGFAGADIESFDKVKKQTKAEQFPLTSCFRCPKKVIELAKEIRADIVGTKQNDGHVHIITFEEIVDLAKPGDLIISRLKSPLVILVFSFIDKGVRVNIHEDEVREVINEIKNIFKLEELNVDISKVAGGFEGMKSDVMQRWRWIIQKDAERIVNAVERKLYVQKETAYLEQRLDFLHRKYEQWKPACSTLAHIIEKIREYVSAPDNSIRLSTIHRAKGLENDRVFILDYDELPMMRVDQKKWERMQEENLKYVAVTRAKEELFLIEAEKVEVLKEKSLFDILPFE